MTIPNSVTRIGSTAFSECSGLTSIVLPDSLTYIPRGLVGNCRNLTAVTIPSTVTRIGAVAFTGCSSLTEITIPDKVTYIGELAFFNCTGLTEITIPSTVDTIGYGAFEQCNNLNIIYSCPVDPANVALGTEVFKKVNKAECTLKVPSQSLSQYREAPQWCEFENIVGMNDDQSCDVNRDGAVNASDVNMLIDIVLGHSVATEAADVNGDGVVDGSDINRIISRLLGR